MDSFFFTLSKLAWIFLSPINIIILLFIVATILLLINRIAIAKLLLVLLSLLSFALLAYPLADFVIEPLESRFSKPSVMPANIDGIIVLGGGEELRISLSWNEAELGAGGDRYIGAAILAKQYPNVPIVFSGGSGEITLQTSDSEANIAQSVLTAVGIEQQRLIMESSSRNTFENFQLMKPKLPKLYGRYLLVTSAYHMPRAVGIARKMHIDVIPYPVDYRGNKAEFRQWDFDLYSHLQVLEPAWREWIGLTVYYFTGKTSDWLPQ